VGLSPQPHAAYLGIAFVNVILFLTPYCANMSKYKHIILKIQ
jgi:hypothetical protein